MCTESQIHTAYLKGSVTITYMPVHDFIMVSAKRDLGQASLPNARWHQKALKLNKALKIGLKTPNIRQQVQVTLHFSIHFLLYIEETISHRFSRAHSRATALGEHDK